MKTGIIPFDPDPMTRRVPVENQITVDVNGVFNNTLAVRDVVARDGTIASKGVYVDLES